MDSGKIPLSFHPNLFSLFSRSTEASLNLTRAILTHKVQEEASFIPKRKETREERDKKKEEDRPRAIKRFLTADSDGAIARYSKASYHGNARGQEEAGGGRGRVGVGRGREGAERPPISCEIYDCRLRWMTLLMPYGDHLFLSVMVYELLRFYSKLFRVCVFCSVLFYCFRFSCAKYKKSARQDTSTVFTAYFLNPASAIWQLRHREMKTISCTQDGGSVDICIKRRFLYFSFSSIYLFISISTSSVFPACPAFSRFTQPVKHELSTQTSPNASHFCDQPSITAIIIMDM